MFKSYLIYEIVRPAMQYKIFFVVRLPSLDLEHSRKLSRYLMINFIDGIGALKLHIVMFQDTHGLT